MADPTDHRRIADPRLPEPGESRSEIIDGEGNVRERHCSCARVGPCPDDDPFAEACPRRRHLNRLVDRP